MHGLCGLQHVWASEGFVQVFVWNPAALNGRFGENRAWLAQICCFFAVSMGCVPQHLGMARSSAEIMRASLGPGS